MKKVTIISIILISISGLFEGFNQAYLFHFSEVAELFPNMQPNGEAWLNKYKNSNPAEGAKFFGSTTFFVGLTDPYHFSRAVIRIAFMLSFVLLDVRFYIKEFFKRWKDN